MAQRRPYPVPRRLEPALARVQAAWRGLLRGGATMPFADDLRLDVLPDLKPRLFLMDVFARPQRFRFSEVGRALQGRDGGALGDRFADEVALAAPLDFLVSQCGATVEAAAPTLFRGGEAKGGGYARLLLPLWGDGRVSLLLGAVDG
jgi:hypothetical protein